MITYLIDGNNLIGKVKSLANIHKKDKQGSREKLAFILDNYFYQKKNKIYLHFDGFENDAIKTTSIKIIYSKNKTADDLMKEQIEYTPNRKNIIVVSSDSNLSQFAKVCSCTVLASEEFAKQISRINTQDNEQKIIDSMSTEEFKKLFGAK